MVSCCISETLLHLKITIFIEILNCNNFKLCNFTKKKIYCAISSLLNLKIAIFIKILNCDNFKLFYFTKKKIMLFCVAVLNLFFFNNSLYYKVMK